MLIRALNNNDVISSKLSDHHPIVHNGILFWNIQMQGGLRKDGLPNNGFGIKNEGDASYVKRLKRIAGVIANIIEDYNIEAISLVEGPIKARVTEFMAALKEQGVLNNFIVNIPSLPKQKGAEDWGVLLLTRKQYGVEPIEFKPMSDVLVKVSNRFQLWKLTFGANQKYIAQGHLPFSGGDEHVTEPQKLSPTGALYCKVLRNLLQDYSNHFLLLCCDFNFNPFFIEKTEIGHKIPPNNSILFQPSKNSTTVTVDGILLSHRERQKYFSCQAGGDLTSRLVRERGFFRKAVSYLNKYTERKKSSKK